MAGFRLKMATQHGEKIAKDFGFNDFPINPFKIARREKIEVQAKPPEFKGVSGALIFANDKVTLIYSQQHNNPGFENFSICHELGHYFLSGHPDEIIKHGGTHLSRANFTEGLSSIELEADHFASGLLMPYSLVRKHLSRQQIGLDGIITLADEAKCSRTSAAIRAAECSEYPVAIIMSQQDKVAYAFMTDGFKSLGKLTYLRKGSPLPASATRTFNKNPENILNMQRTCGETTLADWFDGQRKIALDEEVLGLGKYGYTLTVLSSEDLPVDSDDADYDEDEELEESWTPRFAYGR
ncbi:MAG: ImmA/IrrE family metallo-endopeptidase [Nitrospirales bacterium]